MNSNVPVTTFELDRAEDLAHASFRLPFKATAQAVQDGMRNSYYPQTWLSYFWETVAKCNALEALSRRYSA